MLKIADRLFTAVGALLKLTNFTTLTAERQQKAAVNVWISLQWIPINTAFAFSATLLEFMYDLIFNSEPKVTVFWG